MQTVHRQIGACYWAAHAELKILHGNAQDGLLCQGRDKAISIYAQESISIIGLLHELLFMHLYPRLSHQVYAHIMALKGLEDCGGIIGRGGGLNFWHGQ